MLRVSALVITVEANRGPSRAAANAAAFPTQKYQLSAPTASFIYKPCPTKDSQYQIPPCLGKQLRWGKNKPQPKRKQQRKHKGYCFNQELFINIRLGLFLMEVVLTC
jgi:hypothetical protein